MGQNMIGSLRTVNCGTIKEINGYTVELLGPGYSTHPAQMVVVYAPEGSRKVEVVFDGDHFYIYRFKTHADLQHYWSTQKDMGLMNNPKYKKICQVAIEVYRIVFGR